MAEQNLSPDALEAAATELFFTITAHKSAAEVVGFDWKSMKASTRAPWETASRKVVSAYLAALPAQPELVNTAAELDALPVGSLIRSVHLGIVRERLETGWLAVGGDAIKSSRDLCERGTEFVVLYRQGV